MVKQWDEIALHQQEGPKNIQKAFQQVVCGQRNVFGKTYEKTLTSPRQLGLTLYKQQKHFRALQIFEQTANLYQDLIELDKEDMMANNF